MRISIGIQLFCSHKVKGSIPIYGEDSYYQRLTGCGGVLWPKAESTCNYHSYCKNNQLDATILTSAKCWSYLPLGAGTNECIELLELWFVLLLPLLLAKGCFEMA